MASLPEERQIDWQTLGDPSLQTPAIVSARFGVRGSDQHDTDPDRRIDDHRGQIDDRAGLDGHPIVDVEVNHPLRILFQHPTLDTTLRGPAASKADPDGI
jgi:hypothetical protein